MFTFGKVTSIRVVRWCLDFIVFTGGAMIALMIPLKIIVDYLGRDGYGYTSSSEWPVKLIYGGYNSIPLTIVDYHKPVIGQILAVAVPASSFLRITSHVDVVLIAFDILWMLLTYGTVLLIASVMRKIFLHMESNNYFDNKTPERLRIIGWVMIGASLLKSCLTYLYGLYTSSLINAIQVDAKATVLNPVGKPESIFVGPLARVVPEQLLIGAILLALAIAFQKGLDLKQEQSLTV